MKLTIELELDKREQQQILQNSIERVMNNAMSIGEAVEQHMKLDNLREDASILWQDCEELKPLNRKLWCAVQDAIFRANHPGA